MDGVTFQESAKNQVCDPAMTSLISGYKTDHVNFKSKQFEKLDQFQSFKVVNHHNCKMGRWIDQAQKDNLEYTKSNDWAKLAKPGATLSPTNGLPTSNVSTNQGLIASTSNSSIFLISAKRPVLPGLIISCIPPVLKPITGVPQDMDSKHV